ncbi:hypothetical protein ALC57_08247 [Trachymyrmex cornetzi]|uniref:Uncharacterized protein n=1 Tax=Trachymyrmex cornetzi TaxID=471704 RepID=A0A195E2U0_9HYME|nr:hypothetical protein ALC57_08247 [Trachymyrmex cornetzi]
MPGPGCEKCKSEYAHKYLMNINRTNARIASAVTTVRAAIPDAMVIFILEMLTILFPSRIDERERAPPSNCTIFYFPSRTIIG